MRKLKLVQDTTLGLLLAQQENLKNFWDKKVRDPYAFVPHELKGKISEELAREENVALGRFSTDFLKEVLRDVRAITIERRRNERNKIASIGYGCGYDSTGENRWLRYAAEANLETVWIDVSEVAYAEAYRKLQKEYVELQAENTYCGVAKPQIICGDIHRVLFEGFDFPFKLIEMWYLCRIVGCLSKKSAPFVLQSIGESLSVDCDEFNTHRIIIINAFLDDNPKRVTQTNTLYRKSLVLKNLEVGANRPVVPYAEDTYRYFDQTYRAIAIKAK